MAEEKRSEPKGSEAPDFIQKLINNGEALTTPDFLKGKPTGYEFSPGNRIPLAYTVSANIINLDVEEKLQGGTFLVIDNNIKRVLFNGKMGEAPDRNFTVITSVLGSQTVGLIDD